MRYHPGDLQPVLMDVVEIVQLSVDENADLHYRERVADGYESFAPSLFRQQRDRLFDVLAGRGIPDRVDQPPVVGRSRRYLCNGVHVHVI
jgi:hypothetical protein